nr:MAG TPA: hypothetical protein [Caudoviricetes sp.]
MGMNLCAPTPLPESILREMALSIQRQLICLM